VGAPWTSSTVTLTSGASPAGRVNGVHSVEDEKPVIKNVKPVTGTTPAADYAYDAYLEWDNSAGAWDLVIDWKTDPGSDFDVTAEIDLIS